MVFDLRYYQVEARDAVFREWDHHQATVVVMPTGSGKTQVYLEIGTTVPGRALVIGHRDYLLSQPIARLAGVGFTDVAVEKAEQKSEGLINKAKIVFASVQSLCRPARLATFDPHSFSVVIIDEGHRAAARTYRTIVTHFRRNPRVRFLILTATPKRKDNVGLGNLCDGDVSVAYSYAPKEAADEGWIVPLQFFRREVAGLDFSHVALKGTDLDQEQVEALLLQERPLHRVCASLAEDRGPTLIFCPGVKVAQAYAALMGKRYRPGRSAVLWADSPEDERDLTSKRLAQGDLDYLFHCDLFSEGLDLPELARVVWAAPTASLVKFTQGTGRVFRPHGSLRGQLVGGRDESDRRRLLIEQSPKPYGQVVTYYPSNCRHQLCEPIDVLSGADFPADIRNAAKQIQDQTAAQAGGSNPERDMETAKLWMELRTLLDRRRQHLKARAKVVDVPYDAYGGSRNRTTAQRRSTADVNGAIESISNDWPEGDAASDKQRGWLKYHGISNAFDLELTKWRACVMRDLIESGIAPLTALSYGKKQALAIRDKQRAKVGARDE